MSRIARVGQVDKPRTTETDPAGVATVTLTAVEIALRAAAGALTVQALTRMVRDYPVLTALTATGIGFVFGTGWRIGRPRPARP